VTSQTTTDVRYPRPARLRWRHRRWALAAALSLALTAGAASGLAATPAWAAGGYHITATIGVGLRPVEVAVSPDGTRAYVTNGSSDTVSVLNTATNRVTATIRVGSGP
jgi:YVTN family beta-propeller protein